MTDDQPTTGPDEATRRAAFAELIALQDKGHSVAGSRAKVAKQFQLAPHTVRAIESEGEANEWPPLGD
jgi:hypothetical protein